MGSWGVKPGQGSGELSFMSSVLLLIYLLILLIRKYASEFKQKYLDGILSLILSTEYRQL